MQDSTMYIWSWLNILTKKRYDALIAKYNSLDDALMHIDEAMLRELGCQQESIFRVLNRLEEFDPDAYSKELQKRGLQMISLEDPQYPVSLMQVPDRPVFLYYKGSLDVLNQPCIGCVGRREMSQYGRRVAEHFVPTLVQSGMVTVSGLALGIDAIVAKETLHAGGKTVAVVGGGLAQIYPATNKQLATQIVDAGGLVLCEFPLDQAPERHTFPARNRIIAGLCLGTLVLEAGEGSGALITADLALEYNRDVFAVPGQIFDEGYAGCHQYIADGRAKLAVSPESVLRDIGIVAKAADAASTFTSEDAEEQKIHDTLTSMPQSVSDIVEKVGIDAAILNAKLTMLELSGGAKNVGNGMWVQ